MIKRILTKAKVLNFQRNHLFSTQNSKWQNVFKTTSYDVLSFFSLTTLSAGSALLFENPLMSIMFLGAASVHLFKWKLQALEIDRNDENLEVKIKKKKLFGIQERIFKMGEIEYLFSMVSGKVFLDIFLKEDQYFIYLIPAIADKENFDRCSELLKEIKGKASKKKIK